MSDRVVLVCVALAGVAAVLCARRAATGAPDASDIDRQARLYVQLASALGSLEPRAIDWQLDVAAVDEGLSGAAIAARARAASRTLSAARTSPAAEERRTSLIAQLDAVAAGAEQIARGATSARIDAAMLFGVSTSPESTAATDIRLEPDATHATAPHAASAGTPDFTSRAIVEELERLVGGAGPLAARLAAFHRRAAVPPRRVAAVFDRAMSACRERTARHVRLPPDESVRVHHVASAPWSANTQYLGHFQSVIQINTAFATTAGELLALACHEAYPGHHTYNVLREAHLAGTFAEFRILPLFTPQGAAAEVIAGAAGRIAFTGEERVALLRDVLLPEAGLDGSDANRQVAIEQLVDALSGTIARVIGQYLAGDLDRAAALSILEREALMAQPAATLAFIEHYGAYALAYPCGRGVAARIIRTERPEERRWQRLLAHMTAVDPSSLLDLCSARSE